MPRDIDNPESMAARQVKIGKAQLYGNSPFLLFFKPVGFDSGKGPYQACFSMIDMAGCTEYMRIYLR